MWILRYEDTNGKVLVRNLRQKSSYEIGRDCNENDGKSIRIDRDYISRKHLSIRVEECDVYLVNSKSKLLVTFKTRASTIINGDKYKLAKGENPFSKEFTDSDINMTFKNETEAVKITWKPCTAFAVDKHAKSQLLEAYNKGVDLRITNTNAQSADMIFIGSQLDILDQLGTISFVGNIPIKTSQWISNILTSSDDFLGLNELSSFLLPSTQDRLFESFVFYVDHVRKNVRDAINYKGGEMIDCDFSLLGGSYDFDSFMTNTIQPSCSPGKIPVVYHNNPSEAVKEFCKNQDFVIINDEMLYKSLKTRSVELLKATISCKKRSAESLEPTAEIEKETPKHSEEQAVPLSQSQWRRRKRHKKVDSLAFMVPQNESIPSISPRKDEPPSPSEMETPSAETAEAGTEGESSKVESTNHRNSTDEPSQNGPTVEPKSPNLEDESLKEISNNSEILDNDAKRKRQRITADDFLKIEDLEFKLDEEDEKKNAKRQKTIPIKTETGLNSSLYEAIKQSKKETDEEIKKDLGITEEIGKDDIGSDMSNLAIVETVDLPIRSKLVKKDNPLYQGRKNFKKFRKNIRLKSAVTRTFVEVGEDNQTSKLNEFEKNAFSRGNYSDDSAGNDTDNSFNSNIDQDLHSPTNSQIRIPDNDLFVSNESQSQIAEMPSNKPTPNGRNPKSRSNKNHRNHQDEIYENASNYDDNEDDEIDDMPKFAFTKT